jgi:NDP-sugar pyrophosphorylase family protein
MSGIGKRFQAAGYKDPKPLIEVDNKPMIHHVIDLFPGETKFHFICNDEHLATTRMREILLEKVPTAQIHEVSIHNRKGPVDAVLQIADSLPDDEEIIISYCDYGTVWDYKGFLEEMHGKSADGGMIAAYIGFHPHMLGSDNYAFMKHYDKWVTAIQEKKPYTDNKMGEYASNGTYYFRTGALMKKYCKMLVDADMNLNGEYYVSLVYDLMCQARLNVRIYEIEKMLQWGTPKDLEEYKQWAEVFRRQREEPMKHDSLLQATTILPMAGAGSRFHMVGYKDPKPLLPVNGSPMFIEAVNCLPPTTDSVYVCQQAHLDAYPIQEHLKGAAKVIGIPKVTEGQACTCEIAIREANIPLEKPILISACDNGALYDTAKHAALVADPTIDVIVWAFTNSATGKLYPHMYAWLDVDSEGRIHEVSIKKPFAEKPNTHAIIGTMFFRTGALFMKGLADCYATNNRTNGEFYVDNVLQPLIAKGYNVRVFEVDHYLCWGTPNDYKTYQYWDSHFGSRFVES